MISPTQHSQERDFYDPGGIRSSNPSKRAALDPRLRPRGPLGSAQNLISGLMCKCRVLYETVITLNVGVGQYGRVQTGTDRQLLLKVQLTEF
jgi:hypothetical protein